jgi:broad specificity phosphatase PhoE
MCRHGEVFNPDGVLYARLPGFHLSANGRAMANRLGEYFSPVPLQVLRCSPLERAQETLAPIAEGRGVPVELDDRLIEADSLMAGQVFGSHNRALFNPANWWKFRNPFLPTWGEPYSIIADRMLAAVYDAAEAAGPNARAVLVSHQSPIWIAHRVADGKPAFHMPNRRVCSLASVTTFIVRDRRVERIAYAEPARDLLRAGNGTGLTAMTQEP